MTKTWLLAMGFVVVGFGRAEAAPLGVRGGAPVRLVVHGGRERGLALKATSEGWRLALATAKDGETAELVDVTDGAHDARWQLLTDRGSLLLDRARFVAGHAYRVTLRGATALVYLQPPAASTAASRVDFGDDAPAASDDDELVSKKPTL